MKSVRGWRGDHAMFAGADEPVKARAVIPLCCERR
jgi:hypothetical protein